LPFRHVESGGFRQLMNGVELKFNLPCRITLQKVRVPLISQNRSVTDALK